MSTQTPNINLTKAAVDEFYDRNIDNQNLDKIDAAIGDLQPFKLKSATFDSTNNEIDIIFGKGRAVFLNTIVENIIDSNYSIPTPAINTSYYLYLKKDGTYTFNTTGVVIEEAILLYKVQTGATVDQITTVDLRGQLSGSAETVLKIVSEHQANDALLTTKGHVQLNSATDSIDETTAATPKAIKDLMDLIKEEREFNVFYPAQIYYSYTGCRVYPDSLGQYIYVLGGGYGINSYIQKYRRDTFELVATSASYNWLSSSLAQDDLYIYIAAGTSLYKLNKSNLASTGSLSIGNYGAKLICRDGFIYASYHGYIKKYSTVPFSLVATSPVFSATGSSDITSVMSPNGKLFSIQSTYDNKNIYEMDTSTLAKIKTFSTSADVINNIICADDNFIIASTDGGIRKYDQNTGSLLNSCVLLGTVSLMLLFANAGFVYMTNGVNIYKVDIATMTIVRISNTFKNNIGYMTMDEALTYYYVLDNKNIVRSN